MCAIVLNTPAFDVVHAASVSKTYQKNLSYTSAANGTVNSHSESANFDSVSISHEADVQSRFHKDMVSRLSNEIRTATTTGRIQELRQAVQSGEYHPDPVRIAKHLLFQLED